MPLAGNQAYSDLLKTRLTSSFGLEVVHSFKTIGTDERSFGHIFPLTVPRHCEDHYLGSYVSRFQCIVKDDSIKMTGKDSQPLPIGDSPGESPNTCNVLRCRDIGGDALFARFSRDAAGTNRTRNKTVLAQGSTSTHLHIAITF